MLSHVRGGVAILIFLLALAGSRALANGESTADADSTSGQQPNSTIHQSGHSEIQRLPVRGYRDIVELQPGVVLDRNSQTLYVRGSEGPNSDYLVDGLSVRDEFTGLASLVVNNNTLEEVRLYSGALPATYGNAGGGLVTVETTEGGSELHGTLEASTDNFHGDNYDYNVYSLALNGPVVPGSDRLTFSVAAERQWFGGGRWNWQGKIRWKPSRKVTARVGTLGLDADWRTYPRAFYFNHEHAPRHTLENRFYWGELTYSPSPRTFYRVRGAHYLSEGKNGDGVHFDDLWRYGRPGPDGWWLDRHDLFYAWDDMRIDAEGNPIITPSYDSVLAVLLENDTVDIAFIYNFTRIDSVVDGTEYTTSFADEGAIWDHYDTYRITSTEGGLDVSFAPYRQHLAQCGLSFRRYTVRSYYNYFPYRIYLGWPSGFQDINRYGYDALGNPSDDEGWNRAKHPVDMGAYMQYRLNLRDLVVTTGLRIDRFDYDTKVVRDPANPFQREWRANALRTATLQNPEAELLSPENLTDAETHVSVSPRLSIGIPITARGEVYFSLARFHQRPELEKLYMDFDFFSRIISETPYGGVVFGNAAMEPSRTEIHELGGSYEVSDRFTVRAAAFHKVHEKIPRIVGQQLEWPVDGYQVWRSAGEVIAKGLELELEANLQEGVSARFHYTHQNIDGTRQPYWPPSISWQGTSQNSHWVRMAYERQHSFTGILDLSLGDGDGPRLGGVRPLEQTGISIVVRAESGLPYSASKPYAEVRAWDPIPDYISPLNSKNMPALYRVDLKANREIPMGPIIWDFYLWVLNLFDRDNAVRVYHSTGLPNTTGWLTTDEGQQFVRNETEPTDASGLSGAEKYRLREDDPNNYDIPRQIRFGVRLVF